MYTCILTLQTPYMKIIIDADACPRPVKDLLYKTSERLGVQLLLVANQFMRTPPSETIKSIVVSAGADEADDHIVEIMESKDLVITADIPLADRVIKKGGFVLDPRGQFIDSETIGQRLAVRNLMDELRTEGVDTGGPNAYSTKDKQKFNNTLDAFLRKNFKG